MTGFKLKWFIRAAGGLDTTTDINLEAIPAQTTLDTSTTSPTPATALNINATSTGSSGGKYREEWLVRMVEVARLARLANMTRRQTLENSLQLKIFNTSFSKLYDKCVKADDIGQQEKEIYDNGQLEKESQNEVFSYINSTLNQNNQSTSNYGVEYEDMKTGVMIFYTIALHQSRLTFSTTVLI